MTPNPTHILRDSLQVQQKALDGVTESPRRITPEDQPQFPCWIWNSGSSCVPDVVPAWVRLYTGEDFGRVKQAGWIYSHWHPNQATPPPALDGGRELATVKENLKVGGLIRGKLTNAGTMQVRDELDRCGVFVAMEHVTLQAVEHLPMYRDVVVIPAIDHESAEGDACIVTADRDGLMAMNEIHRKKIAALEADHAAKDSALDAAKRAMESIKGDMERACRAINQGRHYDATCALDCGLAIQRQALSAIEALRIKSP